MPPLLNIFNVKYFDKDFDQNNVRNVTYTFSTLEKFIAFQLINLQNIVKIIEICTLKSPQIFIKSYSIINENLCKQIYYNKFIVNHIFLELLDRNQTCDRKLSLWLIYFDSPY